ncbi:unnamed protein product [Pleuronectes platessa]|uniref:Uncharacterized protein n=1 Tax=Pleuronectes platessa TaxID=8262 RepID=A0A9N7TG86_PLEPL|nr:unnamed protein product [Pleuronectes platessa]
MCDTRPADDRDEPLSVFGQASGRVWQWSHRQSLRSDGDGGVLHPRLLPVPPPPPSHPGLTLSIHLQLQNSSCQGIPPDEETLALENTPRAAEGSSEDMSVCLWRNHPPRPGDQCEKRVECRGQGSEGPGGLREKRSAARSGEGYKPCDHLDHRSLCPIGPFSNPSMMTLGAERPRYALSRLELWKPDTPLSSIQAERMAALREIVFQLPRLTPGLPARAAPSLGLSALHHRGGV